MDPQAEASPTSRLPLEGIRIVDFSRQAPGPYCSMLLADFGAEVILVEPPGGAIRAGGARPEWELEQDGAAVGYAALRRNKRSIELDLKSEAGGRLMAKLVKRADVVMEGFRPGVAARLGFDYESCRALNPRIVYCSITGYGQSGELAQTAGHDINYLAYSGLLSCLALPDGRVAIPHNLVADFAGGGLMAGFAITMALLHRERTGEGQAIDVAMLDGLFSLLTHGASMFFGRGMEMEQGRYFLAGALPHYRTYRSKCGQAIAVGSLEPWFFQSLLEATGRADLACAVDDRDRYPEVERHLTAWFAERTRDEAMAVLGPVNACVAPVLSFAEAMELAERRRMRIELDGYPQMGVAPRLLATPGRAAGLPPQPGRHSDEIVSELRE